MSTYTHIIQFSWNDVCVCTNPIQPSFRASPFVCVPFGAWTDKKSSCSNFCQFNYIGHHLSVCLNRCQLYQAVFQSFNTCIIIHSYCSLYKNVFLSFSMSVYTTERCIYSSVVYTCASQFRNPCNTWHPWFIQLIYAWSKHIIHQCIPHQTGSH